MPPRHAHAATGPNPRALLLLGFAVLCVVLVMWPDESDSTSSTGAIGGGANFDSASGRKGSANQAYASLFHRATFESDSFWENERKDHDYHPATLQLACKNQKAADSSIEQAKEQALVGCLNDKSIEVSPEALLDKVQIWAGAKRGRPRIMCATITSIGRDEFASAAYDTWGSKCDLQLFMTDGYSITDVPDRNVAHTHVVHGAADNAWQQFIAAVRVISMRKDLKDFDFVYFSDDMTFVFVENLRKLLSSAEVWGMHRFGLPLLLGNRMYDPKSETFYAAFGGGFVVNVRLLNLFIVMMSAEHCPIGAKANSVDLLLAMCLKPTGVEPYDTSDDFGADKFVMMSPVHATLLHTVKDRMPEKLRWFADFRPRPIRGGLQAVSHEAVSFHGIGPEAARELQHFVYQNATEVAGVPAQ